MQNLLEQKMKIMVIGAGNDIALAQHTAKHIWKFI